LQQRQTRRNEDKQRQVESLLNVTNIEWQNLQDSVPQKLFRWSYLLNKSIFQSGHFVSCLISDWNSKHKTEENEMR